MMMTAGVLAVMLMAVGCSRTGMAGTGTETTVQSENSTQSSSVQSSSTPMGTEQGTGSENEVTALLKLADNRIAVDGANVQVEGNKARSRALVFMR